LDCVIVVDKPSGLTSHDVVARARRALGIRRIGHAGTLDPAATGVLVLLVGKATRLSQFFMDCEKRYRGSMILGTSTDTQDSDGNVVRSRPYADVTRERIAGVFAGFVGDIDQVPPMVSALKRDGTPLYVLARRGEVVERAPRRVTIRKLRILSADLPEVGFEMTCSRGTYVRTLAHDIGEAIGTGAHLGALVRTGVGPFELSEAVPLADLESSGLGGAAAFFSMFDALSFMPEVRVSEREIDTIATGGPIELAAERTQGIAGDLVRVSSDGKDLAAVGRLHAVEREGDQDPGPTPGSGRGHILRPVRVFVDPL
jgi:tRNA pseudouridine55 synthase